MGSLSSTVRLCAGAAVLLLLITAPRPAQAAYGEGFLSSTGASDSSFGEFGINPVGYFSSQCGCQPCPCYTYCPDCPEGAAAEGAPMAPGEAAMQAEQFAAGLDLTGWSVNSAPGGYLDNPIVGTWFRARYDVAVNNRNPDLAEFFYAKYGNAGGPGPISPAVGVPVSPSHVNYQVGSFYFELLLLPRLSVFAELLVQRTDIFFPDTGGPTQLVKNGGIGDTIAGFKYALYEDDIRYLTFQFKTFSPTGNARRGLGTHHVSLEPALLYISRLSDRSYFQGELGYWIPVEGTDYAGKVLRYGLGVGYDVLQCYDGQMPLNPYVAPGTRVTAVLETVAWTVWDAKFTPPNTVGGAVTGVDVPDGYTVVNVKPGVRFTHGLGSVYAGAGIAVTGNRWYSDLFRVEYRRMF